MTLFESLSAVLSMTEPLILSAVLVFARVSAMVSVLPGFGEQSVPVRLKLAIAVAFTLLAWPLIPIKPEVATTEIFEALPLILSETGVGLLLGLSVRLVLMALQFAGSIASQSASLAQMMGPGATPDPMPAIGNILVMSGLVLALALGLHIKVVGAIVLSYETLPAGQFPSRTQVAEWGVAKSSSVASIAFVLSAPFVIASFAYNLMLGFINRAMPQLMVAFIGAPAITAGGILMLLLAGPALLMSWHSYFDAAIFAPFDLP